METTDELEHLSIGEVLAQLQSEFPDVTISKIRFLESQGLIDPERTPSGYRKFYGPDIARLRWILRQQRDHFLPLKVIKSKLEQGDLDSDGGLAVQGHLWPETPAPADDAAAAERAAAEAAWPSAAPGRSSSPASTAPAPAGTASAPAAAPSAAPPAAASAVPSTAAPAPGERTRAGRAARGDGPAPAPAVRSSEAPGAPPGESNGSSADWLARLQESPRRPVPSRPVDPVAPSAGRGPRFGRAEVLEVTALDDAALDELIQFKLVVPEMIGGEATFDAAAVAVVRSLLPFLRRGVEARHLSMFRNAAEREAGFYEQMILPLLKQRNPKARDEAASTLDELMAAGDELGRALVRQALRGHLGD